MFSRFLMPFSPKGDFRAAGWLVFRGAPILLMFWWQKSSVNQMWLHLTSLFPPPDNTFFPNAQATPTCMRCGGVVIMILSVAVERKKRGSARVREWPWLRFEGSCGPAPGSLVQEWTGISALRKKCFMWLLLKLFLQQKTLLCMCIDLLVFVLGNLMIDLTDWAVVLKLHYTNKM